MSSTTMFRMTSPADNNHTSQILTDFSIETIIGARPLADHKSQLHGGRKSNQTIAIANPSASSSSTNGPHDFHFNANLVPPSHRVASSNSNRKHRPKNFQCPACEMVFSNNGQLKNHVRIHTGERPFRCNQPDCNKTFTRNEELTRHKLIHTGVRPHSCTTCGKCFGRKDHLKKHVRTHDRKKLEEKVSVPTSATHQADLKEDVFAPPKSVRLSPSTPTTDLINLAPQPTWLTNMASSAIQQLATDYWNKWYNFLELYHPQPYADVNRLNEGLYRG